MPADQLVVQLLNIMVGHSGDIVTNDPLLRGLLGLRGMPGRHSFRMVQVKLEQAFHHPGSLLFFYLKSGMEIEPMIQEFPQATLVLLNFLAEPN